MIHVHALRLRRNGDKLPDHLRGQPVRAFLWILPGGLVSGCGPVYRSLNGHLLAEARRPASDKDSIWPVLHDTRTKIEDGVLMIYGSENVQLGGGGYMPRPQVWACRPLSDEDGGLLPDS